MKVSLTSNFSLATVNARKLSTVFAQRLSLILLFTTYGLSGSSDRGILPAGIVEWGAIFSSRGSSPPKDGTGVSFASFIGGRWILYHVGSPSMVLRENSSEPIRCPDKLFLYQGNWKHSYICRGWESISFKYCHWKLC